MESMFEAYLPQAELIALGPLSLRWYGLLMALGALAGYALTRRMARERSLNLAELDSLAAVLLVAGLIGARVFDVIVFEREYFLGRPWEALAVWHGGLAFHGALLFGAASLAVWCRRRRYSMLRYLDLFAPALALGQAIGRWGNYFNQELFGLPTSLPWGIPIAVNLRPEEYQTFTHFHPVFLYESVLLVLLAAVLWRLRDRFGDGRLFGLYLAAAGAARLLLEFLRLDEQSLFLDVRAGFWVAGAAVFAGAWLLWRARHNSKPPRAGEVA